jgi:hypothetical protein
LAVSFHDGVYLWNGFDQLGQVIDFVAVYIPGA